MKSLPGFALLSATMLLGLCACDALDQAPLGTLPAPASALAPENSRISVQLLAPTAVTSARWQVAISAHYQPLEPGAPGTQVTSTRFGNCQASSGRRVDLIPSFSRCERTVERSVERDLPPQQVSLAGERSLNLDFDPLLDDGGARFRIAALYLKLLPCDAGCESIHLEVPLSCYAEDRTREILAGDMQLLYTPGAHQEPATSDCALKKGHWPGWATREVVQARIRGHFGGEQHHAPHDLLDRFNAIPTQAGGWRWNPIAGINTFQDFCPAGEGGYDNSAFTAQLSAAQGWPHAPDVEFMVYSTSAGEVCAIWLDGSQPENDLVSRVRYFYEFANGHLVQVRTDEPDNLERTWRYVDDQPMEYIHKQDPDSIAGEATIRYWHRLAAEEWPALMDYAPDLEAFAAQQAFAQQLLDLYQAQKSRP
ncbi:MAG: hypothetical protein ABWY06_06190 [Pseudomonas sp.]|uniref:hypothetical protein n=1 Tax=Pseudomonas sp. TaxID=306 RepID=UPI003396BDD3